MKRGLLVAVLLGSLLMFSAPASAQRYRAYYGGPPSVYSPRTAYWNGYYANPGYYYRPYTTYYSYPAAPAWGYPGYYGSYYRAPAYYYGW
jgi:hypothetical protein